jgi:hypothetical protein
MDRRVQDCCRAAPGVRRDGVVGRIREQPEMMLELALDAAGLTGTLDVLEQVAAEGKDWIAREKERQSRRLKTYQEGMGTLERI